jgi:uncharacterized protein YodC (DUF2158 family)
MTQITEIGEVVRLKKGGLAMTVTAINDDGARVVCTWFDDDNELQEETFCAESLALQGLQGPKRKGSKRDARKDNRRTQG